MKPLFHFFFKIIFKNFNENQKKKKSHFPNASMRFEMFLEKSVTLEIRSRRCPVEKLGKKTITRHKKQKKKNGYDKFGWFAALGI